MVSIDIILTVHLIKFFPMDTISVNLKISKSKKGSKNYRDAKTIGFTVGSSETEQKKGGLSKDLRFLIYQCKNIMIIF